MPRPVAHHDFGPHSDAARLVLVSGVSQHAYNAVSVMSRLGAFLRRVDRASDEAHLTGRVIIVPGVLPVEGSGPRTDRDYSPSPELLELTAGGYCKVVISAGDDDLNHAPHVSLQGPEDDERETACLFGLPVVEWEAGRGGGDSLAAAWKQTGGESFLLRAGRRGILEPSLCEDVFRALVGFMSRIGLLVGVELGEEGDLHYFGSSQSYVLSCRCSGFFVPVRPAGAWLQAGDLVGCVYDPFDGETLQEVRAPMSGLMSAIRHNPITRSGAPVAHLHSTRVR